MSEIVQPLKVLIIEDNPGDYIIIEDFLIEKFKTPKITHCKSFKETRELSKKEVSFSIILLDLVLTDLQKEALVEQVQNIFKGIPIVILTGYTDLNLARNFIAKGVSDFLLKDELDPELLYKTVVYSIERESFILGLENSKNTYQHLFNFSPQPMWLYDNDTLQFLDVNEATIIKYGYTKEEFLELTIRDIRSKGQNALLEKSLKEDPSSKKTFFVGILEHVLKSGKKIQVEVYSRIIQYNDMRATLVLASDITEKQQHLRVIENQNDKLKKIAWTQSHVIRAPLARFMGLLNLLEIEEVGDEKSKFVMEQLKLSASELDGIINKMVREAKTINLKND